MNKVVGLAISYILLIFIFKTESGHSGEIGNIRLHSADTIAVSDQFLNIPADSLLLDEVVVTAMPFRRVANAVPGSVFILPSSNLQLGNRLDISTYMDQMPGVYMQSATLNTARLTIRGIGSRTPYASNRIKAYFEEIPLTTGDGATIIEDLELTEIDRIEVIKGPSSAFYGPGLGGTFVIRASTISDGLNFRVLTEAGSFNLFRRGMSVANRNNDRYVSATLFRTTTNGHRQNSNYERDNLLLRGGFSSGRHTVSMLINYVNLTAQIPSSLDYNTFMNNPTFAAANWLSVKGFQSYNKWQGGFTINSVINQNLNNSVSIYGILNDAYESRPFNILDEQTQTTGVRQRLVFNRNNYSVSIGGEFFIENYRWKIFETLNGVEGSMQSENLDERFYFNAFSHFEVDLDHRTVLSTGFNIHRLYYNTQNVSINTSGEEHKYRLVFSPRIGLNRLVGNGINIFISAGHGFSAPSSEEALLPDGTINRDLKPEEGYNIDGGIRGRFFNNRLLADITLYNVSVTNLLMTRRDAEDVFYGENAGKTLHRGIESSIIYNFKASSNLNQYKISVTHTLMDNRFKHFIQDGIDYRYNKLPGVPVNSLHLGFTGIIGNQLRFFSAIRYIGSQFLNDSNSLRYNGHTLVDVSGEYRPAKGFLSNFNFNGGIRNLLNKHHASMVLVNAPVFGTSQPRYYYPGQPRTWYAGISFDLK